MLKEFRDFAMKGNVLDLAVAVILGAAFGAVVASAVADILMPPLGILLGGMDFSSLAVEIGTAPDGTPVTIGYGLFINKVIGFVIVAFVLFLLIKSFNRLTARKPAAPPAPPGPSDEVRLLTEIRDLLRR